MVQCRTCGGRYERILPDGMLYFHTCPPLSDPETKTALGIVAAEAALTPAQRRQIADAPRVRAEARDENVVPPVDDAAPVRLKAVGRGEPLLV